MDMIPASSDGTVDVSSALDGATTKIEAYKNGVIDSDATIACTVFAGTEKLEEGEDKDYTFINNIFKLHRWKNDSG
jgi:hypothetical protein